MIEVDRVSSALPVVRFRMTRPVLGRPFYYTAAYWVDGLLIDTGCAHTAPQLAALLQQWQVKQIVNTHSHEDHIGANAVLQQSCGCSILAHPDALDILRNPRLQKLQLYRRLFWGYPKPSRAEPIGQHVDTERFRFQVIHTPGHGQDHICLFEPNEGWLFSGDAYIGGRDRALREGYDIQEILNSLKVLSGLPLRIIFSGSGTVRENGTADILEKVAYLQELGDKISTLHDAGHSSRRIRRRLLGREPALTYLTLGHFSGLRLIRSYLTEPATPAVEEQVQSTAGDSPPAQQKESGT